MCLEINVERQASCALQGESRPVDTNLFPLTMCFMALNK